MFEQQTSLVTSFLQETVMFKRELINKPFLEEIGEVAACSVFTVTDFKVDHNDEVILELTLDEVPFKFFAKCDEVEKIEPSDFCYKKHIRPYEVLFDA